MKCSICNVEGHNKRSCKKTVVEIESEDVKNELKVTRKKIYKKVYDKESNKLKSNNDIVKFFRKNTRSMESNKRLIINTFMTNVKGKQVSINKNSHCGSEGHWLETQMGINHNSKNEPDILGYEMKKSSSKITFGDFSASEYLFSKKKEIIEDINNWKKDENKITRIEFIKYFGSPNSSKNNRYSWSGKCVPTYGTWNFCGQMMMFNHKLDLCVFYSFEKDTRKEKYSYPKFIKDNIVIAIWTKSKLEQHINKKFNNKGFFICKKIKNTYEKICFGKPFDFNYFVDNIKNKNIIFDSGMYEGNSRNYSQFRSSANNFWNILITEEY